MAAMEARRAAALLALVACIACSAAAPMASNQTALDLYEGAPEGCYYNFQHYGEGDRIMTNEPCLNCTCHNRMLMCYLRVCPFTKPIGQDCTVEKRADQCCPIVTCPDVPVDLLTSTSTTSPAEYGATGVGHQDKYGCSINGRYFPEGSKVPPTPNKPCEHCYCIRNMTTCVMQECTLHVDGCIPIYHKDVCCPVRYSCDHPEDDIKLLDDMTTTVRPTPGFLLTTTTLSPVTQVSQDCVHDDQVFADGALIKTEKACEHCYCMKGDIVCVVQECGTPMENEGKNCTSLPPRHGQCCPDTYICEGDELPTEQTQELTTEEIQKSTSVTPPRKGVEGSGYRNEPDEPYTDLPIFETVEIEGSGEDQATLPIDHSEPLTPEKETPDLADEMFITTAKQFESQPTSATEIDIGSMVTKSETSESEITPSFETKNDMTTESTKSDVQEEIKTVPQNEVTEKTHIDTQDYKVTEQSLLTTLSDFISSTLGENLIPVEDHADKTTESTFRKEDDVPTISELTTQKVHEETTTENEYYEQKVTKEDIVPTSGTSVIPDEEDEKKTETSEGDIINEDGSSQTTTEAVMMAETDKEIKENVDTYTPSTTLRIDTVEVTSLNPIENEVDEDVSPIVSPGRIPGEGDCLLNGITYKNTTAVPSTNKCHTSCRCVSSIIKCDPIICSPPPEYANMNNCEPIYDSAESCCPTYICDHSKEGILPESHSQMSGTESPKPIGSDECIGNECLTKDQDKHTVEPIQPVVPEQPVQCSDGICEVSQPNIPCDKNTGCQVTAVTPCEGENCKDITPETAPHISSPVNQDDAIEKECTNDSCRRKEISEVAINLPSSCIGTECGTETQTDTISDLTSELPFVSEEIPKTSYVPTTISSESQTTKLEEGSTTIGESTSKYDSTSEKLDFDKQEPTTESAEHLLDESGLGATKVQETFTTERPKVEGIPIDALDSELDTSTIITQTVGSEEYLTTSSHSLEPQPTVSEEKPDLQQTIADLNKDYTTLPQTSRVESQGLTTPEEEKLTTISLESPGVSVQTQMTSDQEKPTETVDIHYENTTPVIGGDITKVEPYTTESLINKEEDQAHHETHAHDDDHTTEVSQLGIDDGTTSQLITEYPTSAPQSQDFNEKSTEGSVVLDKSTTDLLDDSSATKTKDESTTLDSSMSVTLIDNEAVTESTKVAETDAQPTEQSPEHTKEEETNITDKSPEEQYEISSVIPELHQYDEEHQKTPEAELHTTESPIPDNKETIKDESVTESASKEISESTGQDVMESLNGRVTESPGVHDDLQTVTSHSHEPELHTTILEETVTSKDEIQPEKTSHTTENAFERDDKSETPSQYGTETVKVFTDSITTEPAKIEVISQDDNLKLDDKDKIYTTSTLNEITTVKIDATEQTFVEKVEDKKEVTQQEDILLQTESIRGTTEYNTDTPPVTVSETHIAQSDSTESLSLVTEHSIPERHEVEVTTIGLYPDDKEKTEEHSEGSGDIDIHKEVQEDRDELHTPTEISDEISTQKQDLPSLITTVLPEITENILHTTLLDEEISTKSPSLLVTENIVQESLPTRRVADHETLVTVSLEEEITTKSPVAIETITDRSDLTTKGTDSSEIEDNDKTAAVPAHGSDESYGENETTKIDLISEEKTTAVPEAFTTEELHITHAVTQEDSKTTILEDTKSTEVPDMLTSKSIVTEIETVTEKLSTSDMIEKTTEEPEKTTAKHYYTEALTESTEVPDLVTSSKLDTDTTKLSQTTQEILATTVLPEVGVSEISHTDSEQTTLKIPEINIDLEENTVNVGDSDTTQVTDSPVEVTEIQDIEKQTDNLATTQKPLQQETTSLEIIHTEKITESPAKTEYTESIATESADTTDVSAISDVGTSIDNTQKEVTLPELITESVVTTTEYSNVEEIVKDTKTPEERITERPLVNVDDTEKEIDFATDKTMTLEQVTEKLPESQTIDSEKTTHVEQTPLKETATDMPEFVTDSTQDSDKIDESQKEKDLSATPIAPPVKVPETPVSGQVEMDITEPSDLFIPVETSSDLPEKHIENEEDTTESDEKDIELSTETSEISEPLESVDKTPDATPIVDSVSHDTGTEKTITDVPQTFTTSPSESDIFEGTTLTTVDEKTAHETTSEKEVDNTVKIDIEGEDKTIAYTPEQYTEIPKQTVTEKSEIATHTPEEFVTHLEDVHTFTHEQHEHLTTIPESLITQQVETETKLPVTLSTENLMTTQRIVTEEHLAETQPGATKVPDLQKYTTELDDVATPTLIEQTVTKEIIQTEQPVTSRDEYTQDIHHEVFSETKPHYTSTEKIELSTKYDSEETAPLETDSNVLQAKPTIESTAHPEYIEETSEQMDEHSESTPYFVELEEHTHKTMDEITPEIVYADKNQNELTTEKQEAEETLKLTTEKQESDESVKITTEKQETDQSVEITTEKQETDELTKITTEKLETDHSVEITTEKHETDELTKITTEKLETDELMKITTEKQETDELMKITTEKQETDHSVEISTEKPETDELAQVTTEKHEVDELTKITTEKQETDQSLEITTDKQETDELAQVTTEKHEVDVLPKTTTEKQETGQSMEITTEKQESDELTKITTEEQEIDQSMEITTEKQESVELTKITTEKQEIDQSMEITTEKQESVELTKITTEKQEIDQSIEITTEKQESDELTKITTEKQESDELTKITTEKQEIDQSMEITTEKQESDELTKITTENQDTEESTKKDTIETSTSSAPHGESQTPETVHEISTELPIQDDKITTSSPLLPEIEIDVTKHSTMLYKDITTITPVTTTRYEETETPKQEEHTITAEKEKESAAVKPTDSIPSIPETTAPEEEFIPAVTQGTTSKIIEDIPSTPPTQAHKVTQPEEKPIESLPSTSPTELQKPGFNDLLPTDEITPTDEDSHFPPTGTSGYGQEPDYGEEDQAFGPGTCRYGGKVYVSAQQIPRDDPCDFCFCFRSDIICLQQSCPPPIHGCHEEPIQGFCCPRYECPVSMATTLNITTTTTTTTTTLPPHFLPHAYKGAAQRRGCQIKGHTYKVGEVVRASSGPCLHCTCGGDGQMKCDPKACTPEPMLRQMIAAAVSAKRRR